MTRYYVEITVQADMPRTDREELFQSLAEAVYDVAGVNDADLGANFAAGVFDFVMTVEAGDEVSALSAGLTGVRTAVHAAGGATYGWDDHFEAIKHVVRKEAVAA